MDYSEKENMQRNYYKWIVGTVLIALAVIALYLISRREPFGARNSLLYIENAEPVTKVLISDGKGEVELERRMKKWKVNGKEEARKNAVMMLLEIMEDMRIKSPVSDERYEAFVSDPGTEHTRVKIYEGKSMLRSFSIFVNDSLDFPGIMKKTRSNKAFTMHLPGYDMDPCSYFIAEEKFWLPYNIFSLHPEQLDVVKLSYPGLQDSSFIIRREEDGTAFYNEHYNEAATDSLTLNRYLSYFSYVPFSKWVNDEEGEIADSLIQNTSPYFDLEIITAGNDTIRLFAWKRQLELDNGSMEDTDRLWGSLNGGHDIFVMRYYDIDPVIKFPSYFISD
ncbi:MAG: hypothetical protein K9J25_02660 [Bacteroidales bacterium]|nr:hypothetical protein [Bacteroidales bacterium]